MKPQCLFTTLLASVMLLVSCASTPVSPTEVHDFDLGRTSQIEFYCASCVTGWAVYEIQDGREKRVLNLGINRKWPDLLDNPVRMRRVGIAYPPGDVEFVIRLLPSSPPTQFISRRIQLSVIEGVIIPVRINSRKHTDITMEWTTVVGPPRPVSNDATSLGRLRTALSDPDWGVRWYAAEAIGHIKGDIGEELRAGQRAGARHSETHEGPREHSTLKHESLSYKVVVVTPDLPGI